MPAPKPLFYGVVMYLDSSDSHMPYKRWHTISLLLANDSIPHSALCGVSFFYLAAVLNSSVVGCWISPKLSHPISPKVSPLFQGN